MVADIRSESSGKLLTSQDTSSDRWVYGSLLSLLRYRVHFIYLYEEVNALLIILKKLNCVFLYSHYLKKKLYTCLDSIYMSFLWNKWKFYSYIIIDIFCRLALLSSVSWAGSDQLMTVWLDQTQTVATYLLCDVSTATCEQVGLFMAAHHCIIPLPLWWSFCLIEDKSTTPNYSPWVHNVESGSLLPGWIQVYFYAYWHPSLVR